MLYFPIFLPENLTITKVKKMKKQSIFNLFLIIFLIFTACNSEKSKLYKEITLAENEIRDSLNQFDKKKISGLIDLYVTYADKFTGDTVSAHYLLRAGDLAGSTGRAKDAVTYYDRILQQYPGFSKAPEVLFLKAFAYENYLRDYSKAIMIYQDFMEKYPDHELSDDAQMAVKFMGKSPEEMIRYFEQINDSIERSKVTDK